MAKGYVRGKYEREPLRRANDHFSTSPANDVDFLLLAKALANQQLRQTVLPESPGNPGLNVDCTKTIQIILLASLLASCAQAPSRVSAGDTGGNLPLAISTEVPPTVTTIITPPKGTPAILSHPPTPEFQSVITATAPVVISFKNTFPLEENPGVGGLGKPPLPEDMVVRVAEEWRKAINDFFTDAQTDPAKQFSPVGAKYYYQAELAEKAVQVPLLKIVLANGVSRYLVQDYDVGSSYVDLTDQLPKDTHHVQAIRSTWSGSSAAISYCKLSDGRYDATAIAFSDSKVPWVFNSLLTPPGPKIGSLSLSRQVNYITTADSWRPFVEYWDKNDKLIGSFDQITGGLTWNKEFTNTEKPAVMEFIKKTDGARFAATETKIYVLNSSNSTMYEYAVPVGVKNLKFADDIISGEKDDGTSVTLKGSKWFDKDGNEIGKDGKIVTGVPVVSSTPEAALPPLILSQPWGEVNLNIPVAEANKNYQSVIEVVKSNGGDVNNRKVNLITQADLPQVYEDFIGPTHNFVRPTTGDNQSGLVNMSDVVVSQVLDKNWVHNPAGWDYVRVVVKSPTNGKSTTISVHKNIMMAINIPGQNSDVLSFAKTDQKINNPSLMRVGDVVAIMGLSGEAFTRTLATEGQAGMLGVGPEYGNWFGFYRSAHSLK